MGVTKHRKKHKEKANQRKNAIALQKVQYKKFMQKQIEAIQAQIAANQSTNINAAIAADSESTAPDFLKLGGLRDISAAIPGMPVFGDTAIQETVTPHYDTPEHGESDIVEFIDMPVGDVGDPVSESVTIDTDSTSTSNE